MSGAPCRSTRAPTAPTATRAQPMETRRRGPSRWMRCCWIHAAAVQPTTPAVRANPATQLGSPRPSVTARGTKASVPKKAKVRTPRTATAAGRPGAARAVPGGTSRRNAQAAMGKPAATRTTRSSGRSGGETADDEPRTNGEDQGVARAGVALGRREQAGIGAGAAEGRQRHDGGDDDEREDGEEHGPPREGVLDGGGGDGSDEAGHDPGRREDGEDAGSQRGRIVLAHARVGDRRDGAGAEALDDPGGHEHDHRRRRAAQGEADGEQARARR